MTIDDLRAVVREILSLHVVHHESPGATGGWVVVCRCSHKLEATDQHNVLAAHVRHAARELGYRLGNIGAESLPAGCLKPTIEPVEPMDMSLPELQAKIDAIINSHLPWRERSGPLGGTLAVCVRDGYRYEDADSLSAAAGMIRHIRRDLSDCLIWQAREPGCSAT